MLLEQVDRALVRLGDDGVDLVVDELRRLLRVRAVQRLVVVLPEGERPDRLGHAEDGHLLVRHVRDALHVILRAGGDDGEDDLLGGAPAQRHAHHVGELLLGVQRDVARQRLRVAERGAAARHDAHLARSDDDMSLTSL